MESKPRWRAEFFHHREELVLAVKTAGSVIASVFRAIQFVGQDDFERDSLFAGKSGCVGQLGAGQAGRIRDHCQHCLPGLMRGPGKISGVHAARVGDQGSSQSAKMLVEQNPLGVEIGSRLHSSILRCRKAIANWM